MASIMVKAIFLGALSALVCSSGSLAQSSRDREVVECSCSPTFFQFTITLDQEPPCTNNDIQSNTGIATSETICFKEFGDLTKPEEVEGIATASDGELMPLFNDFGPAANVTSMYFKEFNSQGDELTSSSVTYDPISLVDGQIISFASASASLDPNVPLQDQIDQVPVSVEIKMFGPSADPDDEPGQIISNRLTWTYDMSCGSRPIQTGDNIGWLDIVSTFLWHASRVLNCHHLMCAPIINL